MYRRYYDGYSASNDGDTGEIIVPRRADNTYAETASAADAIEDSEALQQTDISSCDTKQKKSFLSLPGELDDIILIGLLLILVMDSENDDPIILIILGFILLSDFI